jgi:hypothetical protein
MSVLKSRFFVVAIVMFMAVMTLRPVQVPTRYYATFGVKSRKAPNGLVRINREYISVNAVKIISN